MKGEGVREVSYRKLKVFALAAGERNWGGGIGVLGIWDWVIRNWEQQE
jgi:hypothetical protein